MATNTEKEVARLQHRFWHQNLCLTNSREVEFTYLLLLLYNLKYESTGRSTCRPAAGFRFAGLTECG
jgi:hypothetical protein